MATRGLLLQCLAWWQGQWSLFFLPLLLSLFALPTTAVAAAAVATCTPVAVAATVRYGAAALCPCRFLQEHPDASPQEVSHSLLCASTPNTLDELASPMLFAGPDADGCVHLAAMFPAHACVWGARTRCERCIPPLAAVCYACRALCAAVCLSMSCVVL